MVSNTEDSYQPHFIDVRGDTENWKDLPNSSARLTGPNLPGLFLISTFSVSILLQFFFTIPEPVKGFHHRSPRADKPGEG